MFGQSKKLAEALQALNANMMSLQQRLTDLRQETSHDPTLATRVEALERSRATWEAEIDATLTRAENTLRNARAAEERARVKLKKAESIDGDEEGDEVFAAWVEEMARRNGEASGNEGMQPVHQALGRHASKQAAKAMKWGG